MGARPSLGETLLGIEGLALLRLGFSGDAAAREARVNEIRTLLQGLEDGSELSAPLAGPEYDLTEGYELWSETYDQPLRLFSIEQPPMHEILDRLPSGTVLDAACGTGRYSTYVAERGHQVIGVDLSEAMLVKARKKLPEADFRQGDMEDLPVADSSIDAVICALALVHLPNIEKAAVRICARAPPRWSTDRQRRASGADPTGLAGAVSYRIGRCRIHADPPPYAQRIS